MKKIIYLTLICFFCMGFGYFSSAAFAADPLIHTERPTPPYAKWGNLAVQKTKEKYPDAQVGDYLHVGKEDKETTSIEKFKLWLKGRDREFGVLIHIEFNKNTEKIVKITFKEIAR